MDNALLVGWRRTWDNNEVILNPPDKGLALHWCPKDLLIIIQEAPR